MLIELVHIGFGNILAINRVIAIASPNSAPTKRTIQEARNLMAQSNLTGWQISAGPLWVVIEGRIKD